MSAQTTGVVCILERMPIEKTEGGFSFGFKFIFGGTLDEDYAQALKNEDDVDNMDYFYNYYKETTTIYSDGTFALRSGEKMRFVNEDPEIRKKANQLREKREKDLKTQTL